MEFSDETNETEHRKYHPAKSVLRLFLALASLERPYEPHLSFG